MLDGITIEIVLLILIGFIMFISIIVGLIQGFRKNTYYFCATIVFWIIFWITAPLVTGNLIFANDIPDEKDTFNGKYYLNLGGSGAYPYTVIIDQNGVIKEIFVKALHYEDLKNAVENLIK